MLAAAANIINESAETADHVNRLAYARAIIGNPVAQVAFFAPGVLTNPTLVGEAGNANGASGTPIPDSDLDFVVASLWNIYADQYAAQLGAGMPLQFGQ